MGKAVLIKNAKYIVTPDERGERIYILRDRDILVENGEIICISSSCNEVSPRGSIRINADKHVVMPAMINCHTHAAMKIFKGILPDKEFWEWLDKIVKIEEKIITKELVYQGSKLASIEMLLNGVIGFIDMYYYPDETVKAASEYGLLVRTGPYRPDNAYTVLSSIRNYPNGYPLINIHSLYKSDPEIIDKMYAIAEGQGIPIHIHVSETRREVYLIRRETGQWPIQYMYSNGWLNENVILVHLNWILSSEIPLIKEKNAKVVNCPHSAMRLAEAGFCPVYEILREDIILGVGTDGSSGDRYNLLDEIRMMLLLYRHNYWDTRLKLPYLFSKIMVNAYKIFGIKGGVIKPGWPAHLSLFKIDTIRHRPLGTGNLLASLILSGGAEADYVMINGGLVLAPEMKTKLYGDAERVSDKIEEKLLRIIDYYEGELIERKTI